jgi:uncharacterized protein
MIKPTLTDAGIVLCVRVSPGSRKTEIRGIIGNELKLAVIAVPEKGRANTAILDLLAKSLGLKKSQLEIIHGETQSTKQILVSECALPDLMNRIEQALPVPTDLHTP